MKQRNTKPERERLHVHVCICSKRAIEKSHMYRERGIYTAKEPYKSHIYTMMEITIEACARLSTSHTHGKWKTRDLLYVKRDLLYVKRDLIYVKRDLLYVKRDLLYVKRDLLYVKRDLPTLEYLHPGPGFSSRVSRRWSGAQPL